MSGASHDPFEPTRSIGYLVKRVHFALIASAEPLFADADLTFTQWAALVTVYLRTGQTCALLARELGHDMGATSRVIALLEARGLLQRSRDPDDRRVIRLSPTPEGAALAAAHRARLHDLWRGWLADWTPAEVDTLIAGLQRLAATLEQTRRAPARAEAAA
jgi:DNA-binding MarR family transcriptional regulator